MNQNSEFRLFKDIQKERNYRSVGIRNPAEIIRESVEEDCEMQKSLSVLLSFFPSPFLSLDSLLL